MNIKGTALILTNGMLDSVYAKTAHGLLRGTDRFEIKGVIDNKYPGGDAGEILFGKKSGVPVHKSVKDFIEANPDTKIEYCVVGVAFAGGILPPPFIVMLKEALNNDISVVSGLHKYVSDIPELVEIAERRGLQLYDIRKPKRFEDLHFWTGEIFQSKAAKIAVLGMDCAMGKRTTCRFLLEECQRQGIKAEMVYTGQTGWLQGSPYGFIFDSTLNDFVSGELEKAIIDCDKNLSPDLILLEGQSALRNPSGPCGSEFILSGDAKGVILLHAPKRINYDHTESPLPSLESEIQLYKMYGAEVLGIALNEEDADHEFMEQQKKSLSEKLGIPVIRPLVDGVGAFIPAIMDYTNGRR